MTKSGFDAASFYAKKCQRGFSSITAIFLVTVLAALAAAGIQMWRSAADDQTLDMQAMRARSAARVGLQVGFWRATNLAVGYCPLGAASTTNLVLPETLAQYRVALTCTRVAYGLVTRYSFSAVACNQTTSCPDNAASILNRYVEAIATGECIVTAGVFSCREMR